MGITYKAIDVDLRCTVALKVISARYLGDESARLRFLREARAAASVRHPNVTSVLHLGHFRDFLLGQVDQEASQKLFNRKGRRWKSSLFRGLTVFDFAAFEQNRPELELLSDRAPLELHEPDNFSTFVSSPLGVRRCRLCW